MKSIAISICILSWFICTCCNSEPNPINDQIELRSDFSESEFQNAIIGTWNSVYEKEGEANVIFLSINKEGKATLSIEENGISDDFEGNLMIEFLRPTSTGIVTLAK